MNTEVITGEFKIPINISYLSIFPVFSHFFHRLWGIHVFRNFFFFLPSKAPFRKFRLLYNIYLKYLFLLIPHIHVFPGIMISMHVYNKNTLLHMFMGSKVERKSLASEDEFEPSG